MKLTQEERKELSKLTESGFKYIARDEDGELFGFKKEPVKETTIWYGGLLFCYLDYDSSFLKFIKWEDKKPILIKNLLEECEATE